jgi:hypothetical protein
MSKLRVAIFAVGLCGALAGPLVGASASDTSIKKVIESYNSRILVAEGHVVSAIGAYKKTGDPKGVRSAIGKSIEVLNSLKVKVANQSARGERIQRGKSKLLKGLSTVVGAYRRLSNAFGEKKVSPAAAKAEAARAVTAVDKGRKELREAVKLLE